MKKRLFDGTQPVPKNNRLVQIANRTIKNLGRTWQQSNENAVKVDGAQALIYTVRKQGRVCTCGSHSQDVLDQNGNLPPEVIQGLMTGGELEILEYGNKKEPTSTQSVVFSALDEEPMDESSHDEIPEEDEDLLEFDDKEIDDLNQSLLSERVGWVSSRCNICFGNKYVGGYDIFQGYREILDSTFPETRLHIASLDVVSHPYRFTVETSGYVEFDVCLIKGASRLDAFNVWNNDEQELYGFTLSIDGQPGADILDFADGKQHTIRLTNTSTEKLVFSHIEIQMGVMPELPFVDVSQDEYSVKQTANQDQPKTIVLPNTLLKNPRGAVISEKSKVWRVTSANNALDHIQQPHLLEVQARAVDYYEMAFNLPRVSKVRLKRKASVEYPRRRPKFI